ncbi:MAG: hypothetical protein KKB59_20060 [Spirochaetes bacterium]|nr:hypothetical protein [Spirochaetota bacterium]
MNFKRIKAEKTKDVFGLRFKYHQGWWYGATENDKLIIKSALFPSEEMIKKLIGTGKQTIKEKHDGGK